MKTIDVNDVKEAVYSLINFELPTEIWRKIDIVFWTYWDKVGFGNAIDFDTVVNLVEKYFKLLEIDFEHYKIVRIIEIIFEYLDAVGGTTFKANETEGINSEEMRKMVDDQIDFKLAPEIWQEINDVFTNYWKKEVKHEYFVDWNMLTDLIAEHLKKKHILLDREILDSVVEAIVNYLEEIGEIDLVEQQGGIMSMRQIKSEVYNRIDFELPSKVWWEIEYAFLVYWDKAIGVGESIHWTAITSFIAGHLKRKQILFDFEKIIYIVDIIHEYVKTAIRSSGESSDPYIRFLGNRYNSDRIELYSAETKDSSTVIWASIERGKLSLHMEETGKNAQKRGKGYSICNILLSKLFKALYIKTENELVLLLRQEYGRPDGLERMVEFLEKYNIAYKREDRQAL